MDTMKRLLRAYESAKRINFNQESKFIFFSDIHRGDNSISDEFAHNQNIYYHALDYYYDKGFTYIEVGDGDELWEHSNFQYIRNAHSDVYNMIRKFHNSDRFYMLYGNHNMSFKHKSLVKKNLLKYYDEYDEKEEFLFKDIEVLESIVLEYEQYNKEIFVVHGHQGDFINDQVWGITKFTNRHFWHYLHIVGFRNPASPAKNEHKRHKIEKNYTKWIRKYKKMLIVGHTHRAKFPAEGQESYFNTGSCIHPRKITGIEIDKGKIALIEWRIRPDPTGSLYIVRRVVKGPEDVEKFMY